MSSVISCFEHSSIALPDGWGEGDSQALDQINRRVRPDLLTIRREDGRMVLRAGSYVGLAQVGRHSVEILPKLCRAEGTTAEQARQAGRNLLHLLDYALRLNIREHDLAGLSHEPLPWFEMLIRIFASHLLTEWQRSAYRNYQSVTDELPVLRGKLRLPDQLRRPERQHIFSVTYDEFTADNPLNRIFRYVVERLFHLTHDPRNRHLLFDLREWLAEVTLLPHMTAAAASPVLISRLNQQYEPLLNLARLFLEGGSLQLVGGTLASFTFTFDMARLFEAFVAGFIKRHRERVLPPSLQGCDLLPQAVGDQRYLATTPTKKDTEEVFRLKPDLALRLAGNYPLLLDTKYKELAAEERSLGVSQADIYQMHAYARRYNCPRVVLLYPQTASMGEPLYREFQLDGGSLVVVATIDLQGELWKEAERGRMIKSLQKAISLLSSY